ncbi:hypothetical protein [Shinella sp. G-2]|uniref:hypothetical protein n=1 Tax=Shinella sp. G-2 TaxID=3133141 RepID=UPI003D07E38D
MIELSVFHWMSDIFDAVRVSDVYRSGNPIRPTNRKCAPIGTYDSVAASYLQTLEDIETVLAASRRF